MKNLIKKVTSFIKSINVSGISVGTWVRTIMLILSVSVYILKMFGVTVPFLDENVITEIVVGVIGVISFLQAYWKNNSITKAAQEADRVMEEKKAGV